MRMLSVVLMILALVVPVSATAADRSDTVVTDKGPVKGTVTDTHRTFQAIPFAAPPVGENRWRDPQPVTPWTTPRDATKPGPVCAQAELLGQPGSLTEDCLYLNVITPAKPAAPRPVMVWIHGGGFTNGTANLYPPRSLVARNDVVVVTINYRLGAFGFLGFPGLEGSGAFGLADQQAALKWVRRNAKAFGGDPRNVTIFGESAGGLSVCAQLTTPRTLGLFHKAIIQSGPCQLSIPTGTGEPFTLWASRQETEQAGAALGCADIKCLRALPVERLVSLGQTFSRPAYDTRALPANPITALKTGKFHRVPVLVGSTHDEDTLFTVLQRPQPVPPSAYLSELTALFGAQKAAKIAARYPADDDHDVRPEFARLLTDRSWACQSEQARRQLERRTKVFGYEFADAKAPLLFPGLPPFDYKAYHGSELAYLFDFGVPLTPEQQQLSAYMVAAWGRFAKTGEPGWRHSGVQSLAPGAIRPTDFVRDHQCGFWSTML